VPYQNPCLNQIKTKQEFQKAIQQANKVRRIRNIFEKNLAIIKDSKTSYFL
jgi:hypothetical protein